MSVGEPGRAAVDLLVDLDPASPVAELAEHIANSLGSPGQQGAPRRMYVGGVPLDAGVAVLDSPLRDGVHLSLDSAEGQRPLAQGMVEVRVTGGPDGGRIWRLGPGIFSIGGTPQDWITLADPALPAGAAQLEVAADGACTLTPAPGQLATLEAEPLAGHAPWPPGHLLSLGRCLLAVATPEFPSASLRPAADGDGWEYNRPPRLAPPVLPTLFNLPTRPKPADARPLPWVMAVVPLIGALIMAKLFNNAVFLVFALLSPVSLIANYFSDRKHGKKSFKTTLAEYVTRRAALEADAEDALTVEQAQRRSDFPDPAAVGLIATGPQHRLWERRGRDADCGVLRLGTGSLPSAVVLTDPDREEHRRRDPLHLHEVPVTVALADCGVFGVVGRTEQARALCRWLVAQSAALHSPADLSVVVLTDPPGAQSWQWVRWLPHNRPRDGQQALCLFGTNVDTTARRISELLAELTARESAQRAAGTSLTLDAPDILVVLDGSRRLRAMPGVAQLLSDGPAVGLRLICLEVEERLLPQECRAVAVLDDQGRLTLRQTGAETVTNVRADLVSPSWCEELARALAPIRDVSREDDVALPTASRLLDVLGLEPPAAERIAAGWRVGGRTTRAVVGVSLDGPFTIDLATDGPHGLVAGTTGSGKSELLQTIVASLAAANRPDAMTFILVDYKGGSAFGECAKLPHTVGMVTDLDPHLVTRALDSLGAELRRREHVLAAAGVPGLPEYEAARRRDPALASMPRLLIVIDEFASLARELPDFVSGLVNVAQRGRSLGIHLILATQRPSGVVSPEIRANTNLRIALRVTDAAESSDIIDSPDAARISKSAPGRAYARLGHNSLMPFQTARVGGRPPGASVAGSTRPPFVVALARDSLGLPPTPRPATGSASSDDASTDLASLVEDIRGAAALLDLAPQPSPWLPALPSLLLGADLPTAPGDTVRPGALRPAPFALIDVPAQQAREVWQVDLPTFGHLYVAGATRTGRSQTLRTIAGALAQQNSSADVHLYGLDCGNGALLALRSLPHCGAVVRSSERERANRLLDKLMAALQERMALLGELGVTDITEQRARALDADRLPHLVVFIDRWEGFVVALGEDDSGALTSAVMQLLREGASAGIHLVIFGDHSLLSGRIGALTDNKLVLRLADKGDYSLIGVSARSVPDDIGPGRAYRALGAHQVQVALLAADPSGAGETAALEHIGALARERDAQVVLARRPFGVDVLPARISFEAASALQEPGGPLRGLLAVGGDRLTAFGPDLSEGLPGFVIAGPPRSGRSTALRTLAASYLAAGTQVLLVTPRPSPLRELAGSVGVLDVVTVHDLDPTALKAALAEDGPVVILIDDAEQLKDCAAGPDLTSILARRLGAQVGLVLAGDAGSICSGFSGWQVEARKSRRGLLLSPQNTTDAESVGTRISRTQVGGAIVPGRGFLHLGDGNLITVQVPI